MTRKLKSGAVVRPGGFDGQMEELEARILYSADLIGALADASGDHASGPSSAQVVVMPATPVTSQGNDEITQAKAAGEESDVEGSLELVFIDASVPEADQLLALLQSQTMVGRTLEVHWIDAQSDGVSQIAEVLKGREGIDALHIISHGDASGLQLGSGRLDGAWLTAHMGEVASWGGALSADADLLLYGCDLASSSEGRALVDNLALLTGADVAASDDLTGSALLGGDWTLEYEAGQVESAVVLSAQAQQSWSHVLATATFQEGVSSYTGTQDTYIDTANSSTNYGASTSLKVDDGTPNDMQTLIRFDNIIGAGQIPAGSTITAATLTVYVTNHDAGDNVTIHQMLINWTEASTFSSLGSGVATNNVEASSTGLYTLDAGTSGSVDFTGLASSVQAWVNGQANYGWVIVTGASNADDWTIVSSEGATSTQRPKLTVTYTPPTPPALDLDANNSSGATGSNYTAAFTEQTAVNIIDSDATVTAGSNTISPNLSGMTVTISNLLDGAAESLSATTTGTSITASYNSGTGVLTLSGSDTAAHYQTVLRTIQYNNSSDNPTTTSRTINFVASDPYGGNSTTATTTLSVSRVNDAPTATITPTSYSATEQVSLTLHGTGLSMADVDAGSSSVQATISVTSGTLTAAAGTTGVTIGGSGTSTLTLSGTLAQINNLLAGSLSGTLTFIMSSDAPPASVTLTLTASDLGNSGSGGTLTGNDTATINITAVNDSPTGSVSISGTVTQNQTLTASNSIADADGLGTITYHWLRGGVDTAATGSTYALTEADVGAVMSVRATYTDAYGAAETVTSSATSAVANVNDAPTGSVTISGTATQGQTLTASNNIADIDGLGAITYHWYRGGVDTGSTGTTYVLSESDVGAVMTAVATYTDGHGTAESVTSSATAAVANVNDAPTGSVTISGTATQGQTLTASNNIADIDGLGAITYHWFRGGVDTGSTGTTYVLSEADVGSTIVAKATYTDVHGTAETVTSSATAAVANVNDSPTGTVTITGTATQGQTLTASNNIADIDGLGVITYHWYRGGVDTGSTGTTYVLSESDVGSAITAVATYTDAHGTAESVTSAATAAVVNVNDAPTGAVSISGTATQGQTLTASNNIGDIDGLGAITYHWYRGGVDTGSTGTTYVLSESDVGAVITAVATYTDGHGTAESVTSSATTAVANVNDAPTGTVTISGTATQGQTLTASNNIADIDGLGTITYHWYRGGVDTGSTGTTYVLSESDVGAAITAVATYTDAHGAAESVTSSATAAVANVNDAPTGAVTISGTATQGQTLTASNNIGDIDGLGAITYHWYRGGVDTGSTGTTYVLSESDVGSAITAVATYTDAHGTAESVTSAATAAVVNVNDAPTGAVSISGTATQGQTLTASNNIGDIDGLGAITYHWYRGGVDTGSTGTTYVLSESDVGAVITAVATYTDGHGTVESVTSAATASVVNVNDAPTGSVTISGTATQGQTLTASNNIADIDGLGAITYHWYRGGVDTGSTGTTYVLSESDVGAVITAVATYTDGHGTVESVTSAATASVVNVNDAPTGSVTISGTATQGQTLTASNNIADIDGLGAITYHWYRGGVDTGSTGTTYVLSESDVGAVITAVATYTDGHGTVESVTSAATASVVNVNDAPTGSVTISGTATQGQTLTASNNIADIDGLGAITYHWYRGGVDTGSTGTTYVLSESDVGAVITAVATYTDGHGASESVPSAATSAVANVNDAPTGSVTISGTATQGQTLTASNNIGDIDGLGAITYHWYRGGVDTGSTGTTYVLSESDVGAIMTAVATYTDAHGTAESVTSSATAAVANVNDAPTGSVTISGTSTQGQTLTASNNIADIDGLGAITYHWYRGGVDTGSTGTTYVLSESDVGAVITAVATYTDGHGTVESVTSAATASVVNVNDAPTGSVTISGTATQGQTLTASNNIADIDGLGAITYHWYRGGVDTGSTGATYVLAESDVGAVITAVATYTDGHGASESVTSSATAAVANVNDAPTGAVAISGTATQGQTLTASNNIADIDGLGAITYHWYRGGVDTGSTGTTYVLSESDVGAIMTAVATYTDGHGESESVTSSATAAVANVNDAPTGSVTISGTATQGQTLTASNNIADIDGLGAITYHWYRGGVDTGSTGATYVLAESDVGAVITAVATYTDGHGASESVTSSATAAVANVNDAPTGSVTISGTATQGQTLTASNNIADIDGLGAITYHWYRGGVDTGSTGATYVLAESDVGAVITAVATYTDAHGASESVTSSATAAVANVNDAPTGAVTISGTATQGQTLTASNNIADIDGLGTITYHWYRGGVDTGITGPTYVLSESDVGEVITAVVTYTDAHGTAESVTSAATAAVANVNDAPTGAVTISGTATQGQTLTASNNIADIDGLGAITYHWYRGGVDTGSMGTTYVLSESDVGAIMTAVATYTDGHGESESVTSVATAAVANVNDVPTGAVSISGTATQGQTLTASNNISDIDGLGAITYHWYRGGVDTGSTGTTYVLSESDVGSAITAVATYTDAHGTAESVTSAATAAVVNVNDAPTGAVSISGTATQGQTLTASNNIGDIDGLGAITYHWYRGGVDTGSTGTTYVLSESDVGTVITAVATYTDSHGASESVTSAATAAVANVNDAPTGAVTISGTATQGQTLTASNNIADIDGLGTITYHWYRGGVDTGSTGATYVLSESDVGAVMTAVATYTDAHGAAESVTSAATSAVANVNDAPTGTVTISGTATQGQTLTASDNLADIDGLGAITYHWYRGGVDTGSTGTTYVLSESDVGAVITAVATYTDGHGTAESVTSTATASVTNVNDAPTGMVTVTGTATQGQTLTAGNNLADADALGAITYHWLRDGVDTGSTGGTYVLTEADVGKVISAQASYTDGHGTLETVTSSATASVANVNDSPTGSVTIAGTVMQGNTLTASNSIADADGLGAITYHWLRDGVDTGSTGATYALTEDDVGATMSVQATYTDGHGANEVVTSAATAAVLDMNDLPTGTVTVTGAATQGQTLTASDNLADADGLGTITYHWYRGGVDTGSTGATYVLGQADVGAVITAVATYTDGHGTAESVTSLATSAVANVNDVPTGSVTISGTATQGQTLTASNNLVDIDGLGTITYQWYRGGVDTGSTGTTYVLSESDVGAGITAVATYTDGHGTAESVTSAATAAVANVNDAPTGSVTISGTATQGQTLTASNNLADIDGLGVITYHWYRGGVDTGSTGATYVLSESDVGAVMTAVATYTDAHGAAESVTSAVTSAVANLNDVPTGTVTISGTATQSQTLTASTNLADIDGLGAITYHWYRGGVDTGSTGTTYVLSEFDVGAAITAVATYTDAHGTAESMTSTATAAVANINDAPTGSVAITGTATQGQTLTASNSVADIDGLGAITYHWYRGGVDTGSTGSTYVLNESDVGSAITVVAAYTDSHGTAESVTSSATSAVANVNDVPTGAVTISGTATQGQTLTASHNIVDIDGLGTITYHWYRGGVDTGSTGTTYGLSESDVGAVITAVATYTDAHGTAESVASSATSAVANVNDAPTGAVSISGMATQGQTLTASNNIADIDGLGAITYHWYRGGVDTGSTGATYVLSESDVDAVMTAVATYTDAHGTAETITSGATTAVANINDLPTGAVTITGTAAQGQTLTASHNLADADGLGAITYHWLRDGVDTGSTGSTYVLTEADVGSSMTVQATYTDGHGANEGVASSATGATANVNDDPTGAVTIGGTPAQGQTLNASSSMADADGLGTVTYHWLSNGVDTGLTGTTYALSQADVGAQIRVLATYTDQHGSAESMTSASSATVANVNDAPLLGAGSMLMAASPSVTVDTGTLLSTATDLDGDTLTVQVVDTVTHGQLTILGDGSLHYQATAGFSGMDQFTYVAFDGQLQSSLRTVMISVASPPVDEVIIVNPGTGTSTPTTPSTPVDSAPVIDASTPVTPPTMDPIPDPVVVTNPGTEQGTGDSVGDQGDLSGLPPTGASSSSNGSSGAGGALARYAGTSSFNGAYQGQSFNFRLDLGGLDLAFNAGRAFMASINGMKPIEEGAGGLGLNLSLNAGSDHGGAHAASLNFAETPDDQLVKVQKVAVQTSGAVVSVGAVWWAARMSGLLASLMISTPAWRSIDPLPVMGLSNGPEGDDEEENDPLAPQGERHMDEKAAGLFSAQAPSMPRDLERIG
ncbi:DUF4347 domain-containing protein [Aquabacterium sp.]|uniref:DUF4347 domain-containing protein n=1 Tax=Aquabacterium sp. TaxID=1872578 RepID=UPI0024894620|nr:DUF4347 domain-containing protein [Aquabacterium sp.]MDI1258675.1 DUF4347 domain-containing protein [Aquabacterium sp.]